VRMRSELNESYQDQTPSPSAAAATSNHLATSTLNDARAIEDIGFPFEQLSQIAELESWRKEVSRPIYHLHKWWAQRLGSVFRAILIATFKPKGTDVLSNFYQVVRLDRPVVFDPFMGSGTTIGEALKLGARAIGRDINPVAHFAVRNAIAVHFRSKVTEVFKAIEADVASAIREFYKARLPDGRIVDVLYYFWVKVVACPECGSAVDLFSSYVFASHAYSSRHPDAKALCPQCGSINSIRYDAELAVCAGCQQAFNPQQGPARGTKATCRSCSAIFPILAAVRQQGGPPRHRLYAKLVLLKDGSKLYLPSDEIDIGLYEQARRALARRADAYPAVEIQPGYNTNQAINYGYRHWHEMFNERQLLCLSLLAERIRNIPERSLRELFVCLFSGALEFNNMFTSFKGEGTGAVRHMFSHHILKPERTPLEANLWGTPKSSGAFSTLFKSRVLKAIEYSENPFELRPIREDGQIRSAKIYGLSMPLGHDVSEDYTEYSSGCDVYLSTGDSSSTDIASESVDAVVTDPPFFDNVHYSELADFFHVWQRHILGGPTAFTTRSANEVQTGDPKVFAERLSRVWHECHRVLRPNGRLVFTYHHSRAEGWRAVLESLMVAGFNITACHPVKSEMSVAQPKHQAKDPIDLDIIVVCRKRRPGDAVSRDFQQILNEGTSCSGEQIARFNRARRLLSRNDVRVILMAHVIRGLSWASSEKSAVSVLDLLGKELEIVIDRLFDRQH